MRPCKPCEALQEQPCKFSNQGVNKHYHAQLRGSWFRRVQYRAQQRTFLQHVLVWRVEHHPLLAGAAHAQGHGVREHQQRLAECAAFQLRPDLGVKLVICVHV